MSEIKSERAREIIETCHRIVPCYSSEHDEWYDTEDTDAIDKSDAIKAIIKAESDARDRAVRAHRDCCIWRRPYNGYRKQAHQFSCDDLDAKHFECNDDCEYMEKFKQSYDNE